MGNRIVTENKTNTRLRFRLYICNIQSTLKYFRGQIFILKIIIVFRTSGSWTFFAERSVFVDVEIRKSHHDYGKFKMDEYNVTNEKTSNKMLSNLQLNYDNFLLLKSEKNSFKLQFYCLHSIMTRKQCLECNL